MPNYLRAFVPGGGWSLLPICSTAGARCSPTSSRSCAKLHAPRSSVIQSAQERVLSSAWPTGRVLRSTATCARGFSRTIGRAKSKRLASSARERSCKRRNTLLYCALRAAVLRASIQALNAPGPSRHRWRGAAIARYPMRDHANLIGAHWTRLVE